MILFCRIGVVIVSEGFSNSRFERTFWLARIWFRMFYWLRAPFSNLKTYLNSAINIIKAIMIPILVKSIISFLLWARPVLIFEWSDKLGFAFFAFPKGFDSAKGVRLGCPQKSQIKTVTVKKFSADMKFWSSSNQSKIVKLSMPQKYQSLEFKKIKSRTP